MQKSIIYYPDNQDFEQCAGFRDYEKINYNGTRFYLKKGSVDKVIAYYHGNASSACDRSFCKSSFEQSKASIIFVEYAGYSNDNKKPSKKLILKDVQNVVNYIQEKSFKDVVVYGQSIGSGAASYHAYIGKVDSLILVTPFSSLADVAQSKYKIFPVKLLLTENYNNVKWLQGYKGKLVILHGDNDSIVPHKFSQKLFDKVFTLDKEYVLIKGVGHNDIWMSEEFVKRVEELCKG